MTPNPHSIMRRKPLADIEDDMEKTGLFKSLGLWQLTAIGAGGIVGIGVFSLAGLVASGQPGWRRRGSGRHHLVPHRGAGQRRSGPVVRRVRQAGIPRAGSAYTYGYGYVALGEIVGWFIGWDLLLEYIRFI